MHQRLLCLFSLALVFFSCGRSGPAPLRLEDSRDSLSYAIGTYLGQTYQSQDISVEPRLIYRGIYDAMYTDSAAMADSLALALIMALEEKTMQEQHQRLREMATIEAQRSQAFLDSNRREPGVIELASGLQYRILEQGLGSPPILKNEVRVSYIGYLIDGNEFDRAKDEGAIMKIDEVIPGLSQALTGMKPGGFWRIFVPPNLGYGATGRPPSVPPNALLIFDLRLKKILR